MGVVTRRRSFGRIEADHALKLRLRVRGAARKRARVDGRRVTTVTRRRSLTVRVPAGRHRLVLERPRG